MKHSLSALLSLGMMATGGLASLRTLVQRQPARARDRKVAIVVEYADVQAVSIRAGMDLDQLLLQLRASGATHVALAERTLNRLLRAGDVFPVVPREPAPEPAPFGHWHDFACPDARLVECCVSELQARLPHLQPQCVRSERSIFRLAGDLPTLGPIGLGFDGETASRIQRAGLLVVPRPVSYDWHEPALIARSIAQAAQVGDGVIAFDGDLILGHEMHLDVTLAALAQYRLTFAYFAQSRHQRGDWFIAKRRQPHVVIAHQFTPAQMIAEDYHSLSHRWANLASERGVRMCFVNFFRVVHATEPLECLKYLEHVRGALEGEDFVVGRHFHPQYEGLLSPSYSSALALVPVAAGALAARELFDLSDGATLALAGAGMLSAAGLARLDIARDALEQQYRPAYASKLLALSTTTLAPFAALLLARRQRSPIQALALDALIATASAAALAALTSSDEYRLRIEEYKGFDLDLFAPLLALLAQPGISRRAKPCIALALVAGWQLTRRFAPDVLARLDLAPAEGHTHHLSAAMRLLGDIVLKAGPRPIRKWAGLAPFGLALYVAANRRHNAALAGGALAVSALGHAALYAGLRRPERDPAITGRDSARSWLLGMAAGLVVTVAIPKEACRQAHFMVRI